MMLTIPRRVLLLAMALTLAVLGLVYAGTRPAHSATFSKNGVSITVSVTCPSNGTTVKKLSSSGGNPGYAARIRDSNGTWHQGGEVNSGTASVFISAQKTPAHGTRIFWASGAQNYTFC